MLKNTLILPETNARDAAEFLVDAVQDLDVVLMLVFGKDEQAKQAVEWADQLCNKTRVSETLNMRRVVWIRDPSPVALKEVLDPILGPGDRPKVAVLNFHDRVAARIQAGATIHPLALERAFLEGHKA